MIAGLDLSPAEWRLAEVPSAPDASASDWTARDVIGGGVGSKLWTSLEEPLRLHELPKLESPHAESDWLNGVVESTHSQLRLPERLKSNQATLVVATPYAVSPVVRRVMHRLVHGPKSLKPPPGYASCEAPLALALDLLAQRRISPPWTGELITAAGDDLELTALTLKLAAAPGELCLEFKSSIRWPMQSTDSPKPTPSLPSSPSADCPGDVRFAVGDELAAAARRIDRLRRTTDGAAGPSATIHVVDDLSVARGAARYAAYVSRRVTAARILGGFRTLSVSRVLPRTVGIITANSRGEGFWRKLFRAGEPTAELSTELRVGRPSSGLPSNEASLCVLAEITAADATQPWMHRRDWMDAGLVIHSSHEVPRTDSAEKLRLQIRLREHLRLWDDSFIRIAWQ